VQTSAHLAGQAQVTNANSIIDNGYVAGEASLDPACAIELLQVEWP
jgi:hypothetical protein